MLNIATIFVLSLSILGATAKDCPSDRFPDCCASYGFASPDTMKNSFNVPIRMVPGGDVPVGYDCEYRAAVVICTC
tara:strand:+ start:756 stop:983 length:228 start_codon:yes stop_codon:yes gene_type:complete